jgi:hypothetical protein
MGLRVLSLGWGVQSWTLAAMAALKETEPYDLLIHADTGWERSETYEFSDRWRKWLASLGQPVITVFDPSRDRVVERGGPVFIPAFTTDPQGKKGKLLRQCTERWKIRPLRREVRAEMERRGIRRAAGVVELSLGITTDEFMRAKDSPIKYIQHRFPLLEQRLSRDDCSKWLVDHGLPSPGKSACTFCPFHSQSVWREMASEGGFNWEQSVMVDKAVRDKRPGYKLYVSDSRAPLDELRPSEVSDTEDGSCDSGFCFM